MSDPKDTILQAAADQGKKIIDAAGDRLIDRVMSNLLGDEDATRSTDVIVYNHTGHTLYKCGSGFDSGGFSDKYDLKEIEPYSRSAYKVESHGFMSGVTGAEVRFRFTHGKSDDFELKIVTSNPYAGDNSASAETSARLTCDETLFQGDNNKFEVHVREA